jgi:hypothetical protein
MRYTASCSLGGMIGRWRHRAVMHIHVARDADVHHGDFGGRDIVLAARWDANMAFSPIVSVAASSPQIRGGLCGGEQRLERVCG